jgi:DNA-binding response OmpR family regulator
MSRYKVLVVEDDEDLRRALTLRVTSLGYEVVSAQDGISAVSVARTERPDVVLLDLGLPGGDGISVLERYANMATLSGIPVVVLTGRDPLVAGPAISRFNVSALLGKPTDNDQLAGALATAIVGREPDPSATAIDGAPAPAATWFG